ncbi:hypothetical protein AVEN_111712-1 [Araneus ventricosus]|uniref:Uncharacterized protein n=1 Tax=Araneus ventricosus TaxID=182803 RepID=A0A4Y2C9E4_ARAVE|nr:hypothetical protein AVEN_111712-1 [Araneus ventricosus]
MHRLPSPIEIKPLFGLAPSTEETFLQTWRSNRKESVFLLPSHSKHRTCRLLHNIETFRSFRTRQDRSFGPDPSGPVPLGLDPLRRE